MFNKIFSVIFLLLVTAAFCYSIFYSKTVVRPLPSGKPSNLSAVDFTEISTYQGIINFDGMLFEAYSISGISADIDKKTGEIKLTGAPVFSGEIKNCKTCTI